MKVILTVRITVLKVTPETRILIIPETVPEAEPETAAPAEVPVPETQHPETPPVCWLNSV